MPNSPISPDHPIKPEHINTGRHFWSAFDQHETEVAANWLVAFTQDRAAGWKPFTRAEMDLFYKVHYPNGTFRYFRLIDNDWIIEEGDTLFFTHEFVARCFAASPVETVRA